MGNAFNNLNAIFRALLATASRKINAKLVTFFHIEFCKKKEIKVFVPVKIALNRMKTVENVSKFPIVFKVKKNKKKSIIESQGCNSEK